MDDPHTLEEAGSRVERLSQDIGELVYTWKEAPLVKALQGLRRISLVAAEIIVAEPGDMRRFEHPRHLMGYLVLVPSEHSFGESTERTRARRPGNPGGAEFPHALDGARAAEPE
jgi:transposase